jgi:sporulation protein YlmC with PRC-barrel domain
MLKLSQSFIGTDILSLRTGGVIAKTTKPIINPNNLQIEGWYVVDRFSGATLVLLSGELRDILSQGLVVNDHEVLSDVEDLIRLQDILKLNFELLGKPVTTEKGKRIGKVSDYAVETGSLIIKKLYVARSIIKNFAGGTLSVDRTQIIEITNRRVVIEDPTEEARVRAVSPIVAN